MIIFAGHYSDIYRGQAFLPPPVQSLSGGTPVGDLFWRPPFFGLRPFRSIVSRAQDLLNTKVAITFCREQVNSRAQTDSLRSVPEQPVVYFFLNL